MTRTKIKQLADEAQAAIAGVPSGLASKPAVALIAADELIDKLEAENTEARRLLTKYGLDPEACTCSFRERSVGDGCEVCNPIYALEHCHDQN